MITTLHDPVVAVQDGTVELKIQVTYAPGTIEPGSVSYRVLPGSAATTAASVLPLVPAAVVLASRAGQDLRVDEPLPPAMHRGAQHVAALLHRWYGWRPAELIAPLAPEPVSPRWAHRRRGRGVFFTRGIDSWGTVLDLLDGARSRRPTHLVTVDNEVHLDAAVRAAQIAETQIVADRLGLPLIVVQTDIRALIDPHTDWGTETHGSVFAGIGMLLRSTLSEIVISPTHWTPMLRPWGSHPELDPAWSLPDLRVTHHDGDEMRWQRVERVMAQPIAAETVLVCWQGSSTRNCGRCEKCLRLMTSLKLLGQLERCADRFDIPFDAAAIRPDLMVSPHPWCDTMDHLDRVGLRADSLRQRWEGVQRVGRPHLWFQTRPIQPRIPIDTADLAPADREVATESLARHLAPLGLRIDHEATAPAEGPGLRLATDDQGWTAAVVGLDDGAAQRSLADLDRRHLAALVATLGHDPSACVPFDPDGQDPPPYVPEPPGWLPDPGQGSRQ